MATLLPCCACERAMARPTRFVPPVIKTTLPFHAIRTFYRVVLFLLSIPRVKSSAMARTLSTSVFKDKFLHSEILSACNRYSRNIAIIDTSVYPHHKVTFGEYAGLIESAAKGLVAAGIKPGEVIAIYLCNSWEFAVTF